MKRVLVVLAVLPFLSGCAMFQSDLDDRVGNLERRVSVIEQEETTGSKTVPTTSSSTYVTEVDVIEENTSGSVQMSNTEIQTALKNAGYYYGPIDGKIGNKSKRAIREFQADNGLKVDGVVGSQTKRALLKYLSIK